MTTNYVTAIDYAAHGAVEEMALANGTRKERACYNNRLQMTGMIVGQAPAGNCGSATNTLFRIYNQYGANNNGNLVQQDVADSGSWLVQQVFTYDRLNRLETATEGPQPNGWKQTFGYDRWGNRWLDTNGTNSYGVNTTGVANNASWFTAKNRLTLVGPDGGFDAAGNQVSSESFTLSYDAENRMVGSTSGTLGTQSYGYDGEGRRVKKTAGTLTTYYVYDAAGQLAAEYESGGSGPASPCTTCYVAGDHLGSTRALWDEAGLKARYDYHPFGEAVATDRNNRASLACAAGVATCYNGPSGVAQRFTGQLRDQETGLDYFGARYVTANAGRFLSPDKPFADQYVNEADSWNLYTYARNNPLKFIDPDGTSSIESQRRAAVQKAWKLELEMVNKTGSGSRNWNPAELHELKTTGKVPGYEGHHIMNVKHHPELAGDPSNIRFLKGGGRDSEHWHAHQGGRTKLPTKGSPILRGIAGLQVLQLILEGYSAWQAEKASGIAESGSPLSWGQLKIVDPKKAAEALDGQSIFVYGPGGGVVRVENGGFYREGCTDVDSERCRLSSSQMGGARFMVIPQA